MLCQIENLKKGRRERWLTIAAMAALIPLFYSVASAIEVTGVASAGLTANGAPHQGAVTLGYSPGIGEILKMVDAKVDVTVINAYIKNSPTAYNPNANEIIALKQRGVGDDIVTTLIQRGGELRAQAMQGATTPVATAPAVQYGNTVAYDYGAQHPSPYADGYPVDYDYPGYPLYAYSTWSDYGYPWPFYCWPSFYFGFSPFWGFDPFCGFNRFSRFDPFCSFRGFDRFHHFDRFNHFGHSGHFDGGIHASGPGRGRVGDARSQTIASQSFRSPTGNMNSIRSFGASGRTFSSAGGNMNPRSVPHSVGNAGRTFSTGGQFTGSFRPNSGFRSGGGFSGGGFYATGGNGFRSGGGMGGRSFGGGGFHGGGGAFHGGGGGFHGGGGGGFHGGGGGGGFHGGGGGGFHGGGGGHR